MRITIVICVLFSLSIFCHSIAGELSLAGPIQIVTPVNQSFELELDELKYILEADDIKDRNVVVVSIAGAYRKGKSFMLNFFLKYLYAQYKTHDISNWIGENENNSELLGFKWRGGRKPETTGILMWSDIFTHDYENGEKIAIILLDTQGFFDGRTSARDCSTIFALSTMLSSVQCYNLMNNIQENDLQHLQLFTDYGRLALEQTSVKPFQYLLFLVRDWQYAWEIDYGWYGQEVIDDLLVSTEEQTPEMRKLRHNINASFEDIGVFLMPHPGLIVAESQNFTGELKQIEPNFVTQVKQLAPAVFAPENLIVKKINGDNVRARDLVQYLQAYLKIFNEKSLPEPKSVLLATAEANYIILLNDCLNFYVDSMQKSIDVTSSFFYKSQLFDLHQSTKYKAMKKFEAKSKLGDTELKSTFHVRLEKDIQEKLTGFYRANEERHRNFVEKANLTNEKVVNAAMELAKNYIISRMDAKANLSDVDFTLLSELAKWESLQLFDKEKMGDDVISDGARQKLQQDLNDLRSLLDKMWEFHEESLNAYAESMRKSIDHITNYYNETELMQLHQTTRNTSIEQGKFGYDDLSFAFQRRYQLIVDKKFPFFKQQNDMKRELFVKKANAHNEQISEEIKAIIEEGALAEISQSHLDDYELNGLFLGMKEVALEMFDVQKMCDGTISKQYRDKLENDLINFRATLVQRNQRTRYTVW